MSKKRKDIIFRKIKGRIVPIRIDRKKTVKGAKFIAAGVTTGVIGGIVGALFSTRQESTNQAIANLKKAQAEFKRKRGFESIKMKHIGKKLHLRRSLLSKVGGISKAKFGLAASTLIGLGTERIVEQFETSKDDPTSEIIAGIAGGAVLLGTRTRFARKLVGKLHRFVSKKTGMTSKLNRAVVESRKVSKGHKKFSTNQMNMLFRF